MKIAQEFILRYPILPLEVLRNLSKNGFSKDMMISLFSDKSVLASLRHSNPTVSDLVLDDLPNDRSETTLLSYIKRMSYRPVPFGLLTNVSTGGFGKENRFKPGASVIRKKVEQVEINSDYFQMNPSVFEALGKIHWYVIELSGARRRRSIEKEDWYDFLTSELKQPKHKPEVIELLKEAGLTERDAFEFIESLRQEQIIIPSETHSLFLTSFKNIDLHEARAGDNVIRFDEASSYTLAESYLPNIHQVIQFNYNLSRYKSNTKTEIAAWFERVYQDNYAPLAEAAIRFELECRSTYQENELFTLLNNDQVRTSPPPVSRIDSLYLTLYNYAVRHSLKTIDIGKLDLKLEGYTEFDDLPGHDFILEGYNTQQGEQIFYLKSASSIGAGSMLGRFAAASPSIKEMFSELSIERRQSLNPIYAEVYIRPTGRMDEVSFRPLTLEYVIPLSPIPYIPEAKMIHLDKLRIFISNGKLKLWCDEIGKEVIPVISSAMNTAIKLDPVYEFIVEVINGTPTPSNFDWGYLPSIFKWFPEVRCNNVILIAEHWFFTWKGKSNSFDEFQELFQSWASENGLPEWVDWEDSDKYMPIFWRSDKSLKCLYKNTYDKTLIFLKRSKLNHPSSIFKINNLDYAHQIILNTH